MAGDSGKPGASEAASLVFRIATMGLSLASAITTAASTQCVHGGATVSYSDYSSFRYSALADLLSAVLQGVAIYLVVMKKEKAARAVELIDKLLLALTSTSAALLFAVDDITSCGVGESRRSSSRLCDRAGRFCGQIRASSFFSLAAASSVSVSVYTRHVPLGDILTRKAPPPVLEIPTLTPKTPPATGTESKGNGKLDKEKPLSLTVTPPPSPPPKPPSPPVTPKPPSPPVTPKPPSVPPPVKSQPPVMTHPCCRCPSPMTPHVCENPTPSPGVMSRPSCGCTRQTIQYGCLIHDPAMMIEPEEPCVSTRQATQPHQIHYSYEPPRLRFYGSS